MSQIRDENTSQFKSVHVPIVAVAKIRDGRIVESRESYDRLGLFASLGVQPQKRP